MLLQMATVHYFSYSIVCIYIFLRQSSVDGHLGCTVNWCSRYGKQYRGFSKN